MKIIKPNVEFIDNAVPGKKMEYAGRVCYRSFDKITDDSYVKFLTNIVKSGHNSVTEHERVIIKIDMKKMGNPFLTISQKDHMKYLNITNTEDGNIYISGDVRAWFDVTKDVEYDNGVYKILKDLYPYIFTRDIPSKMKQFVTDETDKKIEKEVDIIQCAELASIKDIPEEFRKYHDSKTFDITCSRSASHQLVRHRTLSFSQQSQRYVNYSNDKFGHSINFIMPDFDDRKDFDEKSKEKMRRALEINFQSAEANYFSLINDGILPEDARSVLPNATATQIVITGTTDDWEKFVKLRSDSHAQKEIRDISNTIKSYLKIEV